jgi:hypothetical protein
MKNNRFKITQAWQNYKVAKLEPISKMHLTPNSCVVSLLKMLTYSHVCCAFASAHALLLDVIYYF